jgi:hypothetical protein
VNGYRASHRQCPIAVVKQLRGHGPPATPAGGTARAARRS